jgi:AraC family transcriptional regulator of adaptative response / DNA-3-methyladenine glycosylase II
MPGTRAETLRTLARAVASGELDLDPGADPLAIIAQLEEVPGIGRWTAEYIAMRALRWPDAFPAGDLGLMKATGARTPKMLEQASTRWRPWRAYAAMHLWQDYSEKSNGPTARRRSNSSKRKIKK